MRKLTKAEIEEDENNRTTPLGLFNTAESYWRAAARLHKAKLRTTHPDSPVSFLYYHAIELYLKSFLRLHGHSAKELRTKYSHKLCCLSERAAELGLFFDDEDLKVFSLTTLPGEDPIMRARYIKTGSFHWPSVQALHGVCKTIRESIGDEMKKKGVRVRMGFRRKSTHVAGAIPNV